jgi:hypothetical protein
MTRLLALESISLSYVGREYIHIVLSFHGHLHGQRSSNHSIHQAGRWAWDLCAPQVSLANIVKPLRDCDAQRDEKERDARHMCLPFILLRERYHLKLST